MDTTKTTAVLFDFDGVVMDTETQYSVFWHKAGWTIWAWTIWRAA